MRKPNLYLTLVAMVAMIAVSLGVSSAAFGIGLDKTEYKMYDSLRERRTQEYIYKYNNSINYINSNNKKVSNEVTNLLDKKLPKSFKQNKSTTSLTYRFVKTRASRAGWNRPPMDRT